MLFNDLTVLFALRTRGRLMPGETVLVHGAAGGIGTSTPQMAGPRAARTIAVVSTEGQGGHRQGRRRRRRGAGRRLQDAVMS